MTFTVVELPAVCRVAEEHIDQYGLRDRIATRGADMFSGKWPSGRDADFLSNVLHDWDKLGCERLLESAFDALPRGGRFYAHEVVLDDARTGPTEAASFSLHILMFAEGKQYTAGELEELLTGAGFVDVALQSSFGYWSLVSARKP